MKISVKLTFIWAALLLVCLLPDCKADSSESENEKNEKSEKNATSTSTSTSTEKKIKISESQLCKKCICDLDVKQIDCSAKLGGWFSDDEWKLLQSGDVIFEIINLEHNNLTNVSQIPTYGVQNLYLGHNKIESISIAAFQNITSLRKLDLSHNSLTSKLLRPDVFKGPYSANDFEPLSNLISINLGNNNLHYLDDDLFEHVPNIEELILCSNPFHTINRLSETAIATLASLKTLDISYMELSSLPETILHSPLELETLIMAGNLLTELPKALKYAQNLKRLVLDDNNIGNLEGENVFPPMTNLQYLSMSYMTHLYRIGEGAFSELQNLTQLILGDNKMLFSIDENALSKNITHGQYLDYPPLTKLYLNNCNLTTVPRGLVRRWDKVTDIDLRFNPWICDESNEHMINYLMPQIYKTTQILANDVICAAPESLRNVAVYRVGTDGMIAKNGSIIWVSLLVCVLVVIPIALAGFVLYKRGCFGLVRNNNSRLYDRASFNEDLHI